MPEARHISATHTDTLALDLANKARHVVRSEKYQAWYGIEIQHDQDTKGYFANTKGGSRLTCTVGGKSPRGFHGHFLTVDDPLDPKKALSEVEINTAREFMLTELPTRKVDKAVSVTILIMQRLHSLDPTGVLLDTAKKEGASPVRHICLPARLAENVSPPELRDRYKNGLMDEERLGAAVLREQEVLLGAHGFAGQYMQSPVPLGGGLFKEHYFNKRVRAAPLNCVRIRGWDRASTQDGGCNTAGVLMARDQNGAYYIEHVTAGQWEPDERNQRMRAVALRDRGKYGPGYEPVIYVEAEGGSSGRDAFQGVVRALEGFTVREERVTGKKEVRAEPWSSQLAAGNVYIVDDGTWDVEAYIREHCSFPLGQFKDRVDASSMAFNLLAGVKRDHRLLRVLPIGPAKKKALRIIVCGKSDLATTMVEERCLLVCIREPLPGLVDTRNFDLPLPEHNLVKLIGMTTLRFADLDPADFQDRWESPVEPYGCPPAEVVMAPDQGKKLWSFLVKRRDPPAEAIAIHDEDPSCRRGLSVAMAIADVLRQPRSVIFLPGTPGEKTEGSPPNSHVYTVAKRCREMVL